MSWSPWQSRAAAGRAEDPAAPDLPGVLARFRFHDGPPLSDQRLCLIQDSVDGRWAITGRLTHSGVAMASAGESEGLAAQLGTMLIGVAHREVIDRVSLLVRTVPDDGTDYALWREQHEVADAPELTRQIAAEIDRTVAAASVRTELFVTVCGTEHSLRRAAKAAGGGVAGARMPSTACWTVSPTRYAASASPTWHGCPPPRSPKPCGRVSIRPPQRICGISS
nr:SCO6880 family protein [Pseudonocardia sp. ICBG601]